MDDTLSAATQPPLTLGTAGHIDHGKTALVESLTSTNTDRLPEERSRGISIELGYARLALPSGRSLSVVDVPGHERFVRTMVAGATGIDLFLMAIAADDGVMPQTREHAAVLRALAVDAGVVAVTKSDAADPAGALEQAAALLPGIPAVAVSARKGTGLDELRGAIDTVAASRPGRATTAGELCLHVDRAFTIRGAGTVVTGTLWSGSVRRGDRVTVLPAGLRARVRELQVHDEPVELAPAGQRVAINLAGVDVREVARGDAIVAADGDLAATYVIDASLDLGGAERDLERGGRVQVHHGTREAPARVAALGDGFWQLRLEQPLLAAEGDRLVVRRIAPPDTLGGGTVVDASPRKHGASAAIVAHLQRLARGEAPGGVAAPRAPTPPPPGVTPLSDAALALERRLKEAGGEPPREAELQDVAAELAALRAAGRAVRVGRDLHFHPAALAGIEQRVVACCEARGSITLAELRDELGTTRRFAQALLEHFDGEKLTRREGDAHVLRGRRPR